MLFQHYNYVVGVFDLDIRCQEHYFTLKMTFLDVINCNLF